ncbi:MAG: sugar-binding protein [Candidatus Methylacidiphilales bacterium]
MSIFATKSAPPFLRRWCLPGTACLFIFAFIVSILNLNAKNPGLKLTPRGVSVDAGVAGKFLLEVPGLRLNDKDYSGEKAVVEIAGDTLVAKYPSGAELKMALDAQSVDISFTGVPATAKALVFMTKIPIQFTGGGKYGVGKKEPAAFPENKEKQIIAGSWADSFTIIDPAGEGYRMEFPGDYMQLQDNRVFNWAMFVHIYSFNFDKQKGKTSLRISFSGLDGSATSSTGAPTPAAKKAAATSSAAPKTTPNKNFMIDRYGQSVRKDYPGKVKSDEELKADGDKMIAELATVQADPKLDIYGGLAGSGEQYKLKKTGFFHVEKAAGRDVLVTPEGNVYFQLAVCGIASTDDFTTVRGREKIYEWVPQQNDEAWVSAWRDRKPTWGIFSFYIANWIRKFGRPFTAEEWTAQAVKRLRSWGFNSAGAFCANTEAMKAANFPTVAFLPLGKGEGIQLLPDRVGAAPVLDPFYPGTEEALDKRFAKGIAARANDPLLIGYYLGNEQHMELLPKLIPTYKASNVAAKARLVQVLQDKYKDIAKFNAAWNPAKPFASFDELKEQPLFIRTEAGAADMKAFYIEYMEAYSSMVERVFRRHDKNHMLIGSRMTPGTANNEIAVSISAKYTDIVSINYYTYAIEEGFLKKVYEWSGHKPMIFSEWYYATTDHGLNGGKELKDQSERAKGYRNYIEQSAALPFVVGSQWFIYMDQSITGRFFEGFNGEGANTGFVDVTDRPYQEMVDAAKVTHARIYDVMLGKEKAFAYEDVRFNGKAGGNSNKVVVVPKALPGLKMDGTTTNWPGRPAEPLESSRLVLGVPNPSLRGDFRLCWDEKNLYFLIQIKDPTPLMNNKKGKQLWSADGIELFIGGRDLTQPGNMIFSDRQILIGASETPKLHVIDHEEANKECQSLVVKDVTGDGYVLQTVIPWTVLGIEPKSGMELLFDVSIDNSDDGDFRKQQLAWNGTAKNSNDRASWGRARLVDN